MKRKSPLKSYEDLDFLKSDVCRPARLQLEFLKPEVTMEEKNVKSTIVLFGSARIPSPEQAKRDVAAARKALREGPRSKKLQARLHHAEQRLEQSRYYTLTREFAALVSKSSQAEEQSEFVVMTGGGGGIMEAGNRGAHDAGAKSIGLNISLPFEQLPNQYISDDLCFQFHYFSIRKMHFLLRAKALCAFPGGFGTMDEVFETLTLIQTHKITPIPIVLFGGEFWREIINWDLFLKRGFISPEDLDSFRICETAVEGWQFIRNFWNYNDVDVTP